MITLLAGAAILFAGWWLLRQFAAANPATLAKRLRQGGGVAALALAGLMLARGRIDMAIMVGGAAGWLLGWGGLLPGSWGRGGARRPGSVSRVRSAMIEMELDHDTGTMTGSVLAGGFVGRSLGDLDEPALKQLLGECRAADPDGARLLEPYLDRRFPGWREDAQPDGHAGIGRPVQAGVMTEQEAYQILGLQPGSTAEDVRRAHRALMMKLHPDQGGTTYLAARINEAKDLLLSRHR